MTNLHGILSAYLREHGWNGSIEDGWRNPEVIRAAHHFTEEAVVAQIARESEEHQGNAKTSRQASSVSPKL